MMQRGTLLKLLLTISLLSSLAPLCAAQSTLAPDPSERLLADVQEFWSSPFLSTSHLRPVRPVSTGTEDHGSYTLEVVGVKWRPADNIDLYVMKPKGVAKPPVILYLYGHPSDVDRFQDAQFQKLVTRDGFAAVGFVSALEGPRFHNRGVTKSFVSELQESLATSAHDVQLILDYLERRGDLDMTRVGMYAQGSGASIAILASAVDPRIRVLDTIDPWGDWPDWLAGSPLVPEKDRAEYLKPDFLKNVEGLDPVEWLPRVQAKSFRLQDVTIEPNTPANAKKKLRLAVPVALGHATIQLYQTPEEVAALVRQNKSLEWIQHELRALDNNQAAASNQPPGK